MGALAGACGGDATDATDQARASEASDEASPSCDRECRAAERRAEREAEVAARCKELLPDVTLTYRLTAEPVGNGSEIGLHMALANRSHGYLTGATTGRLDVDAGGSRDRISWGGSSADELAQEPGTVERREVWHDRMPPGWHPVGSEVTSFAFSTYAYAPGRGLAVCYLPARVVAPRGLVADHASGHWTQQSSRRP